MAETIREMQERGDSGGDGPRAEARALALDLLAVSVLKREKVRRIREMLGDPAGCTCLDIGGDNGVVSLVLRSLGGRWTSADLDGRSVAAISELVGERVARIDGSGTPFPAAAFDRIVVVDFLEHIETDGGFVRDLARIIRPGGILIVNVPRRVSRSVLRRVRNALGLTDERHGHVRPGYSLEDLRRLLAPEFRILEHRTYSRSFSETLDTVMTLAFERLDRGDRARTAKGTLVTREDQRAHRRSFRLLRLVSPALRSFAWLDRLLFLQPGYKLIVRAERCAPAGEAS